MRRYTRNVLLPAVVASCFLLGALAQEECQSVEQARQQLEYELEAVRGQVVAKSAEAEARLAEAQKYYEHAAAAQNRVAELEAELEAAKEAGVGAGSLLNQARSFVVDSTKGAVEEVKLIYEDLKGGNTGRLGVLAYKMYSTAEGVVSSASNVAAKQYETMVPEGTKRSISEAVATGQGLWQQHCVDSEWSQKVRSTVGGYHVQLKDMIGGHLEKNPGTKSFADPTIVGVIATSIMVCPVILILLPLLCGGSKKKAAPAPSISSRSSKRARGLPA